MFETATVQPGALPTPGEAPNLPFRPPARIPGEEVYFTFQSKLFEVPGIWFALTTDRREAAIYIPMGEHTAFIPLPKLGEAFNIDVLSPDGDMLSKVAEALDHVTRVTPGERIPREIVDGTASWSVDERHHEIAARRLAARLVRRFPQLAGRLNTPDGELDVAACLREAAAHIEKSGEVRRVGRHEATLTFQAMCHETSYVEALREEMRFFDELLARIGEVKSNAKQAKDLAENAVRITTLMRRQAAQIQDILRHLDTRLDDILFAVADWNGLVHDVRYTRNRLHRLLLEWEAMRDAWRHPPRGAIRLAHLVRDTYHFVAMRQSVEWVWPRGSL